MTDTKPKTKLSELLYGDMNDTQKVLLTGFCIGLTLMALASTLEIIVYFVG